MTDTETTVFLLVSAGFVLTLAGLGLYAAWKKKDDGE